MASKLGPTATSTSPNMSRKKDKAGAGLSYATSPITDRITMPPRGLFANAEEYWSTFWHEAGHASGQRKRLNRDSITEAAPFGSATYSVEEIVAEMTAAYLCGITGIENRTIDNSAAYVVGWLRQLRDQRKLIIHAAA